MITSEHSKSAVATPIAIPGQNGSSRHPGVQPMLDARNESRRIQELIERVESLPNAEARELVQECLRSLLALYGDGWARVLQLTRNAGAEGEKVREALLHDKLIRSLLLIHGLHPQNLETRLRGALDK